ncbi:hypothetical protein CGU42_18805 [Pseudomonas aeruginosa]|nr:hypothetical protein CGU46_28460 [Pseudomonas aeruginosa]ASP10179.1 hypothetical protein CGU45_02135 [Pseudomonas aeruginosa]KAA5617979.1 hypothetical protein F3H15_19735 [Pseudomonas aeruginosa]KAA5641906.1 hypothetical protein F3H16_12410 [Pseudomonas aeruginosa]KAA5662138.1 hypothetical protein F3G64_33155 [Pseudomonas aeruginosa]
MIGSRVRHLPRKQASQRATPPAGGADGARGDAHAPITPRCACSVPPLRPAPAGLFQPPFESTHHGAPPGTTAVCLGAAECR